MSDGRRTNDAYPGIDILVSIEDEGWVRWLPGEPEDLVRRAVEAAAARADLPTGIETELGVTLTSDAAVRALNRQWRAKDRPTNILSFPTRPIAPGQSPGLLMGDLVLALETCASEAQAEEKSAGDHVSHLVVHGFLHLLGHDHLEDEQAERMERMEILILSDLSIGDPYRAAGEEYAAQGTER